MPNFGTRFLIFHTMQALSSRVTCTANTNAFKISNRRLLLWRVLNCSPFCTFGCQSVIFPLHSCVSNSKPLHRVTFSRCVVFCAVSSCFSSLSKGDSSKDVCDTVDTPQDDIIECVEKILQSHKIILFLKGTPDSPKCGFSAQVVRILNALGLEEYSFVDVLASTVLREGIKKYSEWPTIPQLYIQGEFIGGCDILMEMYKDGRLKKLFEEKGLYDNPTS